MCAYFGQDKNVADVTVPKVLLESGKFAQVCKIVESLVYGKRPSQRQELEKKIKQTQSETKIDQKDILALFDRLV